MKIKDPYLRQRFTAVEESLQKASNWGRSDPELNAYLAGYLVVLISGVYEDCIEHLIDARASNSNDPQLTSYVRQRTSQSFRNPDTGKVMGTLKEFSTGYRNEFDRRVEMTSRVALDSIVDNKNWLAHGDTSKLQVTVADVNSYFRRSLSVFEILEDIFSSPAST